jgi:hypothetical protein
LNVAWFCSASRAAHWTPASLANRTMHAVPSIAMKRVPPECHPIEYCDMAWRPTSLPAGRSTVTFLAHAVARAQYNLTIDSVWSAAGFRLGQLLPEQNVGGLTVV